MCNVTFQTLILLMNTIVTKAKIYKNQNVDISSTYLSDKLPRIGVRKNPTRGDKHQIKVMYLCATPEVNYIFIFMYNVYHYVIVSEDFSLTWQDQDKINKRSRQDQDKIKTRPRQDQTRSRQYQDNIKTRSRKDQEKIKTRSRQDQDKIKTKSGQEQYKSNTRYDKIKIMIKTRLRQNQDKIKTRSKQDQDKLKTRARQNQDKI